jgi:hypothetical protein
MILSSSATTSFDLGGSAGVRVERDFSPSVDFTRDYEVFDEQRSGHYRQEGERTKNRVQVVQPGEVTRTRFFHGRRALVGLRDIELMGGEVKFGDSRVEVPQAELPDITPRPGDLIEFDDGQNYRVFAFDKDDMAGLYILWSRQGRP